MNDNIYPHWANIVDNSFDEMKIDITGKFLEYKLFKAVWNDLERI